MFMFLFKIIFCQAINLEPSNIFIFRACFLLKIYFSRYSGDCNLSFQLSGFKGGIKDFQVSMLFTIEGLKVKLF